MHRGSPAPLPLPPSPVPSGSMVPSASSQQLRPNPSLRIVPPGMQRNDHPSEVWVWWVVVVVGRVCVCVCVWVWVCV